MGKKISKVTILFGENRGKFYEIKENEKVFLGRGEESDIILDRNSVSKLHCCIYMEEDCCLIMDLGSTNGTYVNDEKADSPIQLFSGDIIRAGGFELMFESDNHNDRCRRNSTIAIDLDNSTAISKNSRSLSPFLGKKGDEKKIKRIFNCIFGISFISIIIALLFLIKFFLEN